MSIPTNAADAISAISDGQFGTFSEAKIGDIVLGALTELDNPEGLIVTEKPVEDGSSMNDMAIDDNAPLTMTVVLANPEISVEAGVSAVLSGDPGSLTETWRDKRAALYQYKAERTLITAQTHEGVYDSRLVQSITPIWDNEENWDAFFAIVVLKKINTFAPQTGGGGGLMDTIKESAGGL